MTQFLKNKTRRVHRAPRARQSRRLKPELLRFLHSKINIPPTTSIRPGSDFYRYINGAWLRHTPMPPYASSYGVSEEVDSHIEKFIFKEIYACQALVAKGKPRTFDDTVRYSIGQMALSSLRPNMQKNNVEFLKRSIRSLGCIRDTNDIASALGAMCRFNIATILEISISQTASIYRINLSPGSLGLPHLQYYNATVPGKSKILYAYTGLLARIVKRLDIDDLSYMIPLEAIFAANLSHAEKEDESIILTGAELVKEYKNIPWDILFKSYGIEDDKFKTHKINVDSPGWFSYLNKQMIDLPLEQWQSLLTLHTILHALPYLPPPFDTWHHYLYGRLLRGQRNKTPQDILTLNIVKNQMPTQLGYIFVKKYLSPEFKSQATQFVNHIVDAAVKHVKEVEWFTGETRRRAAEKIRGMTVSAGYYELPLQPPPTLQPDNLLANIYILEAASTDQQIRQLLHGTPKGFWKEPPYTVNAYYYHETNQIIIPAGCFFWPFFNEAHKEWIGWNYGGLGATIGHEITHAFDTHGRLFNESGNEKEWWSSSDLKNYGDKTAALVKLFTTQKVLGRGVDGKSTLNENLADLGGLAIALDALKSELTGTTEERARQLRDFFISYAISWRTKEHSERRLQRLILDIHAPVELRVNLIVSQFEEWYQAFDITEKDALYIPPEERIRIF